MFEIPSYIIYLLVIAATPFLVFGGFLLYVAIRARRKNFQELWKIVQGIPVPFVGDMVLSFLISKTAPYTGSINPKILDIGEISAKASMKECHAVRNPFRSIHAAALVNLGEFVTGLVILNQLHGKGKGIPTALRIEYYKKSKGTVTATCSHKLPVDCQKKLENYEVPCEIHNEAGELVCKFWVSWVLDFTPKGTTSATAKKNN